jgi:dipeptidyl aminopeptidase/acylaminoacyl peptidase
VRKPAAALVAAAVALFAGAASTAAATPVSSLIAYSDTDGSLYASTVQAASASTLFTGDDSATMSAVALSPDGKQVLAIEYGDQTQLVLVPVAGGAPTAVAGTTNAGSGAFSPDGTKIAFSIEGSSGSPADGIYTVSASGGTPTLVAATPSDATDSLPAYSPDGTKLAFVRDAYDDQGNETVSLELTTPSGGPPRAIATGLAPDLESGDHLSFSPDGKKIAYAGDYSDTGIFTVPVAGGTPTQLTSDYDYWPSFSADGSTVYFVRDATSTNADDNASAPAAAADVDLYELWSVSAAGTGAAVIAEGDFENLVLATIATTAAATTGTPSTPASTTTTTPSKTTPATIPAPAKSAVKTAARSAISIKVAAKGARYTVKWTGKSASWTVVLKVGAKTHTIKLKGSIHSHVFVLPGAHGAVSARVKAS